MFRPALAFWLRFDESGYNKRKARPRTSRSTGGLRIAIDPAAPAFRIVGSDRHIEHRRYRPEFRG
jgi:hypothetical protein